MPRLRLHVRHLYLLALFQLVGGPLVLLTVIGFSKVVVHHVHEEGLKSGISSALHSSEWREVIDQVVCLKDSTERSSPDTSKLDTGKAKFLAIAWAGLELPFLHRLPAVPSLDDSGDWSSAWPHAPPIPPPRLMLM